MRSLALRGSLAAFLVLAGANHFRDPAFYLRMMPPYLPWHEFLNLASGAAEIALGVLLLVPPTSRAAAWGTILLLVAVFPANVHMALHPDLFPELPPAAYWARLPIQGLFLLWAWACTRPVARREH